MTITGLVSCLNGQFVTNAASGDLCVGPTSYASNFNCSENQNFQLVSLNATTLGLRPLNYIIASLPSNGYLSQYADGRLGSSISFNETEINSEFRVYYTPYLNFYGNDSFTFYARDKINSTNSVVTTTSVVSILVNFFNQPPVFKITGLSQIITVETNRYFFDISTYFTDPDEAYYATLHFEQIPRRGKWYYNSQLLDFSDIRIPVKSGTQLELDIGDEPAGKHKILLR